jgi:peptide/nickel transport system substrate-binding protein
MAALAALSIGAVARPPAVLAQGQAPQGQAGQGQAGQGQAGQGQATAGQTLRVVMHSDLKILDPIWSGAYIVRQHGYLVYDTLFAIDADFKVRPQMAEGYTVSPDGLTTTIRLREGLAWHDGTPVTAEDCIASLKRWAVRDSLGQKLAAAVAEWRVIDARTFAIVLKEPFGAVIEAIGKPSVVVPFMMPRRIAETDPFKQADEVMGSGPFMFKRDEWKPGDRVVYVRNPAYRPRPEPASGLAGGKVAKVDRVEWVWIPDPQTQVNALINGEIDLIESVAHDLLPVLAPQPRVRITRSSAVNQYQFRMNWSHPPFNDVRLRQAAMLALSQADMLEGIIGNKDYYRPCKALFTCGGPYETMVGMDGLVEGDVAKARELVQAAGYDGTRVVLVAPSDLTVLANAGPIMKAALEKAGFRVDLQVSDWQTMATRLGAKRGPPSEGGWSAFTTSWQQIDITDPLLNPYLTATCEKARPGWPCDAEMEAIRDRFARATDPAQRRAIAEAAQVHNTRIVTHVPAGEWFTATARRTVVTQAEPLPPFLVFWGVEKQPVEAR